MARPSVLRSKTLPQGEFTSPEDVKSALGLPFCPSKMGLAELELGRIEGELKQKLLELRG